jgi:hypothetical protein
MEKSIEMNKKYLILIFVILYTISCNMSNKKENANNNADLIIKLTVIQPEMEVGFGYVYNCKINEIIKGSLPDTSLTITILANDKETNEKFMELYKTKNQIEIGFTKNKENEVYSMIPITGFVDKNKTSWKMESLNK